MARAYPKVHTALHHIEIPFYGNLRIDFLSSVKRISFTYNKAHLK